VCQIGHLPELYEDAQWEKYEILYHSDSLYKLRDNVLNSEKTASLKMSIFLSIMKLFSTLTLPRAFNEWQTENKHFIPWHVVVIC
jgi:hypothetical protein